nr:EOG090X09DI [Eurycercus lamellatus]
MSGPVWKKPDEVMKQMREKKKALQARFGHAATTSTSLQVVEDNLQAENSSPSSMPCSVKRKNPFRRSPAKRPKLLTITQEEQRNGTISIPNNGLFNLLHVSKTTAMDDREMVQLPPALSLFAAVTPIYQKTERCMVDWSLKTKARFTSKTQFAFSSTLKTSEEASGITGFVRCINSLSTEEWSTLDTSTNSQFHQCCLLWQYPWLPWLSLFPRDARAPVNLPSNSSVHIGLDANISNCLVNDWCESFRSLFGLLRARQCPFFYVCTHQFNVLFRAAGIGGVAETHALMTPTTRGLRDILRREDITFSMPLKKSNNQEKSDTDCLPTSENAKADEGDPDDEDGDDEDDEWINDIGLHSNLRSKLEAERLQDGGQGTSQGSYSDSLLLIEGVETQGLFNWLLNSKLCLSSTGPLAGIPPTLLSPVSFHHSTLRPLKVRQGLLKQDGENVYSVEVQGPVLPHSIVSLMKLLQTNDYTALLTSLASTKPFAAFQSPTAATSAFGKESLSDCGLDRSTLDLFCTSKTHSATEIRFVEGSFYFD